MMTSNQMITRIRDQLYDAGVNNLARYSSSTLCAYIGAGLRALAELRPEAVTENITFTLVDGARQRLDPLYYYRVLSVVRNPDDAAADLVGAPLRLVERDVLDSFYAAWPLATGGNSPTTRYQVYALDSADPLAFYLFPSGVRGQEITVKAVRLYEDPYVGGGLLTSDMYAGPLVDYAVYRALLSEGDGIATDSTLRYYDRFLSALGIERAPHASVGQAAARPPEAKS